MKTDIIIPTYDNEYWLGRCLRSIEAAKMPEVDQVIIIDNFGNVPANPFSTIVRPGKNLGWTSALVEGLKRCQNDYVLFLNDDTEFEPKSDRLSLLMSHFENPKVGITGPATGMAMSRQAMGGPDVEETNLLIGFCQVVRRKALDDIGGLDETWNVGGDDFDICLRMAKNGWKLVLDRRVFVYHHAFKTGQRLYGKSNIPGGWNSPEMAEDVFKRLADKFGEKALYDLVADPPPSMVTPIGRH